MPGIPEHHPLGVGKHAPPVLGVADHRKQSVLVAPNDPNRAGLLEGLGERLMGECSEHVFKGRASPSRLDEQRGVEW